MNDYLNNSYAGNTLLSWVSAIATFIIAALFVKLFSYFIKRKVKKWISKSNTTWDDFIVAMIQSSVIPCLYLGSIYLALSTLDFNDKITNIIHIAFLAAITYFTLRLISAAFKRLVHSFINRQENSDGKVKQAGGLIIIVNIVIWILGIIFLLDNLGYNVTTLVAGLGIGGIAIALAAQTILADLFSYFVIFFDRPFEIGDLVVVDDKSGTIEYIGIKTTRIRTLGGEQLICSNTDLTNSRLHNYKRLAKRRIVFTIGVTYNTTHNQLLEIPEIAKKIMDKIDQVEFNRGHFSAYDHSSLNFEFVYYVMHSDYAVYMDKQQEIYLALFAAFKQKGIDFAFPTQTVYLHHAD